MFASEIVWPVGLRKGLVEQLEPCVQFWAPQYHKDTEALDQVQRREMEPVKGLEHKSYIKWPRELRLSLEEAQGRPYHPQSSKKRV